MPKGKYFIESVKEGCDIIYLFMALSLRFAMQVKQK